MDPGFRKFIDDTCNSPYDAQRVSDSLEQLAVTDIRALAERTRSDLEDGVRLLKLVDEMWVSTHVLRVYEAARVELSRSKSTRRPPTSPHRGKTPVDSMDADAEPYGDMHSVEEEVKRMRLQ